MKRWLISINMIVLFIIISFNINWWWLQNKRLIARTNVTKLNAACSAVLNKSVEPLIYCDVLDYWRYRDYLSIKEQQNNIGFIKILQQYKMNHPKTSISNEFFNTVYENLDKLFYELEMEEN